jgi:hypothetical protein
VTARPRLRCKTRCENWQYVSPREASPPTSMPEPWHGGWLVAAAPTPRGNLGARASVNETTVSQSGGDAKGWSSDEPAATGGPRMRQGTGRTRVIFWRRCGPLYGRVLSMRIGASHPANSPTGTAAPSRAIGAPGPFTPWGFCVHHPTRRIVHHPTRRMERPPWRHRPSE